MILMISFSGLISLSFLDAPKVTRWVISKNGSLQVKGSTNVNTFSCVISNYATPDTITVVKIKPNDTSISLNGEIGLNVQSFDCHHPMMTADLRKTLKAKEFPKLYIRFINLSRLPVLLTQQELIKGWVEIELANKTKLIQVDYKIYKDAQKTIHLIGNRNVNFTDFNLVPPRKLGGMIQTNNLLNIEFHLQLKNLNY